jgi:uncharacterized membrane protein
MTSTNVQSLQVLELFPQTRQVPQYFAEFGDKLPQKLKNGVSLFMLINNNNNNETAAVSADVPTVAEETPEPEKKKRKKAKKSEEVVVEEESAEKAVKKKIVPVDTKHQLYLKATQDGVLGKKGELIEAQKIPSGTVVHLVKGKKYKSTLIFYESFWYEM